MLYLGVNRTHYSWNHFCCNFFQVQPIFLADWLDCLFIPQTNSSSKNISSVLVYSFLMQMSLWLFFSFIILISVQLRLQNTVQQIAWRWWWWCIVRVDSSSDADAAAVQLTFEMVRAEFAAMEANANTIDTSKEFSVVFYIWVCCLLVIC